MNRPFVNYPYQNLQDLNLDFVLRVAREAVKTLEKLGSYDDRIESLENAIKQLERGNLPEEMVNSIIEIVQKDIVDLVGEMVKFVFFGLTDDGRFVAYIPEPWNEIIFNTTEYDIRIEGVTEFGRLVLSY